MRSPTSNMCRRLHLNLPSLGPDIRRIRQVELKRGVVVEVGIRGQEHICQLGRQEERI